MHWVELLSGVALGALVVRAYLRRRRTLTDAVRGGGLDDHAVEQIIREGSLSVEDPEPLDLGEIARAEEEFWETDGWDPAEEDRV